MVLCLFFSFSFSSATAAATQSSQTYNARMGFEVELPNLLCEGEKDEIAKGAGWTLDTDSHTSGNLFDIEYTTDPYDIAQDTGRILVQNIQDHFSQIQITPPLQRKRGAEDHIDHMRPQITFQISLELVPLLMKHLYIISGREELKKLIHDPRLRQVFFLPYLSKVNGLLALFTHYVQELFYDNSFTSARLTPDLKGRLQIMSRFSFTKMYHTFSDNEKAEFNRKIREIYGDQLEQPRVIVYTDYRKPTRKHFLTISIMDWLFSIQNKLPKTDYDTQNILRRMQESASASTSNTNTLGMKIGAALRDIARTPSIVLNRDLLSPPRDLGECNRDLGMGAGDFFPNLQESTYGEALVEIRLYGSLASTEHPLRINKLGDLILVEQNFLRGAINLYNSRQEQGLPNPAFLHQLEREAVADFCRIMPLPEYRTQAEGRINEIFELARTTERNLLG